MPIFFKVAKIYIAIIFNVRQDLARFEEIILAKLKVVLYNPHAVFHTMPLALLAIGSHLDADRFDVRIVDARIEPDALQRVIAETKDALCFGVTMLTGRPLEDALRVLRAVKAAR